MRGTVAFPIQNSSTFFDPTLYNIEDLEGQEWFYWHWRVRSILLEWSIDNGAGFTDAGSYEFVKSPNYQANLGVYDGFFPDEESLAKGFNSFFEGMYVGWSSTTTGGSPIQATIDILRYNAGFNPLTKVVSSGFLAENNGLVTPARPGYIGAGIDFVVSGNDALFGVTRSHSFPMYEDPAFPFAWTGTFTATANSFYTWDGLYDPVTGAPV